MVSSDAAVPLADAAVVAPVADAALAVQVAVDAAVVVDAARAPVAAAQAPLDAAPVEHHVEHKNPPAELSGMKPAEAFAACGNPGVLAANPVICTIAACKAKDLAKARKWLTTVPAGKRSSVTSACPALAPKDDDEACKKNPLACQH
jgi:hypothetical protein